MSENVSVESLVNSFPYPLSEDAKVKAIARIAAVQLMLLWSDNDLLGIYDRIDQLDEDLLDILAQDFRVKWYRYDGTVETKRGQIKAMFNTFRHLGTAQAVKYALAGICDDAVVIDWFKYSGLPHHFKLEVNNPREIGHQQIIDLVEMVMRKSSILDLITIISKEGLHVRVASIASGSTTYSIQFNVG